MEAGNREEEDGYFGATLATHNFGSPARMSSGGGGSGSSSSPPPRHSRLQSPPYQPTEASASASTFHPRRHPYHQYHQHLQQPSPDLLLSPSGYHSSDLQQPEYHPTAHHRFDSRAPFSESQPVFYAAAANLEAANANATTTSTEPGGLVDPDSFYRSSPFDLDHLGLMASTLPASRQLRDAAPLRSNGNGPPSKLPVAPPSTRPGVRPALRSVSAPVDDSKAPAASAARSRAAAALGPRAGQKPSVKDLKKKFDQSAADASSTSTARRVTPSLPGREAPSPAGYRSERGAPVTNGQAAYATLRSSTTRGLSGAGPSAATRSTSRVKAEAEDQVSNNSQSFASRVGQPRGSAGGTVLASKSMTHLTPTTSPDAVPPVPRSRALLFGEIAPDDIDSGLAGFGIQTAPDHRTGEPLTNGHAGTRQRSFSHTDADPPSPSDWYRDVNGLPSGQEQADESGSRTPGHHSRSRSDLAGSKSIPPRSRTAQSSRPQPTLDTSSVTASSRLPVSLRKISTPSNSSSPTSTRSNTPNSRRRNPGLGKIPKPVSASGTKTPTKTSNAATKRSDRSGAVTPNSNARLNAYIAAPLPKLSPPLRSSRPRQPVSTATTASSRMKAVGKERSPSRLDLGASNKPGEQTPRRRKISMGPIDFESRREQIKLSYSKSIRDSEARTVARRMAEERRKRTEAEAAKARTVAEETSVSQDEGLPQESTDGSSNKLVSDVISPAESVSFRTITTGLVMESPADSEAPSSAIVPQRTKSTSQRTTANGLVAVDLTQSQAPTRKPPLYALNTGLLGNNEVGKPVISLGEHQPEVSPTLGIPGSFPGNDSPDDQEVPASAISNTTEFDGELQTEPPVQETPVRQNAGITNQADQGIQSSYTQSEYRSPFEDESPFDDGMSIKVSLDASAEVERPLEEQAKPTSEPSGSCGGSAFSEDEYEPKPLTSQSYQTKVTILGRDTNFPVSPGATRDFAMFASHSVNQDQESDPARLRLETAMPRSFSYDDTAASNYDLPDRSANLSEIEEFFVGPTFRDATARPPAATAESAEPTLDPITAAHQTSDAPRFSSDSRRTAGTRLSLTVPRTSESMNRTSQTTVWTDYSVDSQESFPFGLKDEHLQQGETAYRGHRFSEAASRSQSSSIHEESPTNPNYSRDVSPHVGYQDSESLYDQRHQLPEIDTGEGFAVDYASRKNSTALESIPVLPDHSPPPPPDDISFRDAMSSSTTSDYYNETRPSSYLRTGRDDQSTFSMEHFRRDSEDIIRSGSISRSIDQSSLETSEGQQSGSSRLASQQTLAESMNVEQEPGTQELPPKERKRLFTRLETIKELIDTEAFFIRDMNIVEEIYKGTAEACINLDDKTVKLIFRNSDDIIKFHSRFLVDLKEGVSSVYTPKAHRGIIPKDTSSLSDGTPSLSASSTVATGHLSDEKDRATSLGPTFLRNIEKMTAVHETFLKNSDNAAKRLIQIQEDPTVQVWLNECNEVARDLTKAWNLDSLLIKPMQRITKYPNLIIQLLHETPANHPDRPALELAKVSLETAIEEINKTKKNFELVGQIVGRKRKESDVRAGFARAFGKRVDKLQPASNRPLEDPEYVKLHEKFGDDYLRLQVVLRDVEFYTRQVQDYVHEFLQYLSAMELVMRLQPSPHPEIESKWVRFNVSMRDIEKVALEQHLSQVRKQVIEPFEQVIKAYGNPSLAMKKRTKRRLDYEKSVQLKKSGKKIDKQLVEFIEQYEALNEALKKELPKLSTLTEKVGNICLGNFVSIQAQWYAIWKEKVKAVLDDQNVSEVHDIVSTFQRDYKFQDDQMNVIGIANPISKGRPSQSTSMEESLAKLRSRPVDLSPSNRGYSTNSDMAPSLPTPDFVTRTSGQFTASPSAMPSPHQYYHRDYAGNNATRPGSEASYAPELSAGSRPLASPSIRPDTGKSYDSGVFPRQSGESISHARRYSNNAHPSPVSNFTQPSPFSAITQPSPYQIPENQRYSGLFQSALPVSEGPERLPMRSRASSRASSRERQQVNGFNVLWLAASLFEFNIEKTKHEAGYPYLTYHAGEIFDVIGEKGELWLAKNQDDPENLVGWLWSKHFAKLADD
ncbi:hypothetical protein GGR56DRAFT_218316 [Xylariaceae sp. FL0804]|nr:hypothetical protein GGR56DRAFT_218316 [Xylariaceae sp. FL0804]